MSTCGIFPNGRRFGGTLCNDCIDSGEWDRAGTIKMIHFLDGSSVWYCTVCNWEERHDALLGSKIGYKEMIWKDDFLFKKGSTYKRRIYVDEPTKHRHWLHGKLLASHLITRKHKRQEGDFYNYEEWEAAGKPKPCREAWAE